MLMARYLQPFVNGECPASQIFVLNINSAESNRCHAGTTEMPGELQRCFLRMQELDLQAAQLRQAAEETCQSYVQEANQQTLVSLGWWHVMKLLGHHCKVLAC